jgi:hypothetical protein
MRIAVLTKRRTGLSAVLEACAAREGHDVTLLDLPNLVVDDTLGAFDLVVVKSKQLYFLYAGFHAQALGVTVVPDPSICKQVSTRIERPFLARRAGIAIPRFYFASPQAAREQLSEAAFPLVRKPMVGSGSAGVSMVASKAQLPHTADRHLYLERFVPGRHLLVYFIADEVRTYQKQPFVSGREPVVPLPAEADVAAVVERWKRVTGLGFGHLDLVRDERTGGLVMVDAGAFPQFRHWPGAAERVSAMILAHLPRSRDTGGSPTP